mmetsp:Transcript_10027/g.25972  ORF Transcript_10027/g.25972 Transcript_10027/m.25972 type:complete len:269 (+) Transcript_10027:349-1155(+)
MILFHSHHATEVGCGLRLTAEHRLTARRPGSTRRGMRRGVGRARRRSHWRSRRPRRANGDRVGLPYQHSGAARWQQGFRGIARREERQGGDAPDHQRAYARAAGAVGAAAARRGRHRRRHGRGLRRGWHHRRHRRRQCSGRQRSLRRRGFCRGKIVAQHRGGVDLCAQIVRLRRGRPPWRDVHRWLGWACQRRLGVASGDPLTRRVHRRLAAEELIAYTSVLVIESVGRLGAVAVMVKVSGRAAHKLLLGPLAGDTVVRSVVWGGTFP